MDTFWQITWLVALALVLGGLGILTWPGKSDL